MHPHRLSAAARGAAALLAALAAPAFASSSGVVISQIYGGGGNTFTNDYVELFNAGTSAVSINGWSLQYAAAASTGLFSQNAITTLSGTIQPGQYYLVKLAATAGGATLPAADATGTNNISATAGKLIVANVASGVACNGSTTACSSTQLAQIVDLVGYGATATYSEGSPAPAASNTTAILRANNGCTDTGNNAGDFAVGTPAPRNAVTTPAPCAGGTPTPPPPPAPAPSPSAAIYQIQGSGMTSPYVGQAVTTTGIVTKVNTNGFFLQDAAGDGNPATSDGIFVFTGTAPTVAAGQALQVTGTVQEFNVGATTNTDTAAHTVTELGNVTGITVTGSGTIHPVAVSFPLATQNSMEQYEGMLVTLTGPFTVQQNYFLGRFGELTLGAGGRLQQPTNVVRPGTQAQALNTDNIRRTLVLDDGSTAQNVNPTPYLAADNTVRAGDTVAAITGVVDYGLTTSASTDAGAYKIHPTAAVTFARANPRTAMADGVGGNLRIGSANVENFFTTLDNGTNKCPPSNTADDCRGANSAAEFTRQETKIVELLVGLNADAVALMELQNDTGNTALQELVRALNARLGGTVYQPVLGTNGGTDAIRVGMIYKPSRLSLVGAPLSDAAAINNRAPMAQTFQALNGERFNLVANHLKSKSCGDATQGSGDADSGDLQGCFNGRRVQQADELRTFVAQVQAARGVNDTLLVGDFNAYAKEDPIVDLTGSGYVDQIGRFLDKPDAGSYGYSYVFNGTSGRLDHAIANATLSSKVTGVTEWHVNADEPLVLDYNLEFRQPACATCNPDDYTPTPYRASDHDPIVVGLNLVHAINGTAGNDVITGTPGDDVITGGVGADRLTGNGGRDVFAYTSLRDVGDTITDFTPYDDRLDLNALLASLGANPATALSTGVVQLVASGSNTVVMIDTDGSAGPAIARPLVTLLNVSPSGIDALRDLGLGTPAAAGAAARASAQAATLRTMTAARTISRKSTH